jgi:hypothetical protein
LIGEMVGFLLSGRSHFHRLAAVTVIAPMTCRACQSLSRAALIAYEELFFQQGHTHMLRDVCPKSKTPAGIPPAGVRLI